MSSVSEIASAMKSLLTETARRLGRESKFVKRESKLDGAGFAQTCVLGWSEHPDASLSQLSQTAASVGVTITPQGLDQRFDQEAASFLRTLLEEAAHLLIRAHPRALPILARFSVVQIQDSTTIGLPDGLVTVWRGCGDATGGHRAALQIRVGLDLLSGALHDLLLASARTSDQRLATSPQTLPTGALAIADLGFFAVARLAAIAERGAFFLNRLLTSTAVYDVDGQRLVLEEWLGKETARQVERTVQIGARERLDCRLLAVRVDQEIADQRRHRLKAEAKRKGRTLSPRSLVLADWATLVTNAPPEKLTLDEAFVLVRVRWQIGAPFGPLFKLWKAHAKVDEWRTSKEWRILCEVYAKLLGILLQHWLLVTGCWDDPDRSLVKAAATVRDHVLLIIYALRGKLDLVTVLTLLQETLAACPKLERRAKRPATFQLLENLDHAA
jgi:Transposase DDE domain